MTLDKMIKRPYEILPYNPGWVLEFEKIRGDVAQAFGSKALSIEHIGSTSIVGMGAKHCIDVLVVVEKYEPFVDEKNKMEGMGYKWAENYINPDTLIFYKENPDLQKTTNIHVCERGSGDAEKFTIVTGYLRAHPDRARMYNELKIELNKKFPNDYPSYRAGKEAFLTETKRLALEWENNLG